MLGDSSSVFNNLLHIFSHGYTTRHLLFGLFFLMATLNSFGAVDLPEISVKPDAARYPFKWNAGGYLMQDGTASKVEMFSGEEQTAERLFLRRARMSVEFEKQYWSGQLEIKLEQEVDVHDAYLSYSGFSGIDVLVGRMKIPAGLEMDVSSRHLALPERSAASELAALGRGSGVKVERWKSNYGFTLGAFDTSDWNDQITTSALRLVWSPISEKRRTLHLGFHSALKDWTKGRYRLRTNGEIESEDDVVLSPSLAPKKLHQNGLELAYQQAGFLFQTEYTYQDIQVQPSVNESDVQYQLLSYQLAWFPFGQQRRYREGVFKRVSGKEGVKKIELVLRQSEVDAFSNNSGSLLVTSSVGVNWYPYKNNKLMFSHQSYEIERPVSEAKQNGSAWTARWQWEFDL